MCVVVYIYMYICINIYIGRRLWEERQVVGNSGKDNSFFLPVLPTSDRAIAKDEAFKREKGKGNISTR